MEFTLRMQCGTPVINVYEFDKEAMNGLKVLKIAKPNMEWMKFIMSCRSGKSPETEYDVIIAPFPYDHLAQRIALCEDMPEAKDTLYEDIINYFYLKTVLKTEKALSLLKFKTSLFGEDYVSRFSKSRHIPTIIDCFVEKTGIGEREALRKLYSSKLYEKLSDPLLKTVCFSGSALAEMLISELETGKFSYPDEDL